MNGDGTLQPTNGRVKDVVSAAVTVGGQQGGHCAWREIIKISDCTNRNYFPERGKSTSTG